MYFVGVLFGLGFDTSTEIALLAITATTTAGSGENKEGSVPPLLTLILPLTFASAMSLLDTLDGILMTSMYGWAETNPRKKLLFNVFLTGTSSLVAIGIGTIETLQVLSSQFHWKGSFWLWINELPSSEIGWGVIGLFISSFLIALIVYTTMFGCKGG
jgi:high-affinity nickel-transport protein